MRLRRVEGAGYVMPAFFTQRRFCIRFICRIHAAFLVDETW
jgi:hypothetical protein